jgi:HAD superfamily hydrolase (TIGR01509 family)
MPTLQHVLFDNDGTIVDSEIIAIRSMLELLAPYGFSMTELEYAQRFPGLQTRVILELLRDEYGLELPNDMLHRLRSHHIELFDRELRAIRGMPTIFRRLKVPKSMVSNGSVAHVERSLRKVRLLGALDGRIFSADHVERPKPHPDLYRYALEQLGLPAEAVLVVEDSPTGVTAAHAAGVPVVGFLGAGHVFPGHEAILRACGAEVIAADARQLTGLLRERGAL